MKSVLLTTCYLNDGRYFRMKKWLEYYIPLMSELGVEKIYLLDNASDDVLLQTLMKEVGGYKQIWDVIKFTEHLPRNWDVGLSVFMARG